MTLQAAQPNQFGQSTLNIWAMVNALVKNKVGILVLAGAPTSGTSGSFAGFAGPGSILVDNVTPGIYFNANTLASPLWTSMFPAAGSITPAQLQPSLLQQVSGTISSANLTGTSAGQFGHAAGVTLVAAVGAHKICELVSLMLAYDFATAAYTAGGNITVNNIAGGAALTGLVSAANSVGASADKVVTFNPLDTAGDPAVENGGLSLVSSAAFTNPGTAAGVINWIATYRVLPTSLT